MSKTPLPAPEGPTGGDLPPAMADLQRLLAAAGLPSSPTPRIIPIHAGRNNRVYRVDVAGDVVLLKAYFHHPADVRDRLGAEFAFTTYARGRGITVVPRPLAADRERRLGLYEFVQGSPLGPGDVGGPEVEAALAFVKALNAPGREEAGASGLPAASESSFSLDGHLRLIEQRVRRLERAVAAHDTPASPATVEAAAFVEGPLVGAAARVLDRARAAARGHGLDLAEALSPRERVVSPSDFGFHNAIREASGALRFLDFEYAGWDDPARLACDFFCQPQVPVPREHFVRFVDEVTGGAPRLVARARVLAPVYQVKWCCILLNELLPEGRTRRTFAGTPASEEAHLRGQVERAASLLGAIEAASG